MSEGPVICAVIGRTRHRMVQMEIQEAARRGAKMIEVRLDYLARAPNFKRLLENRPCPIIATIRKPKDGGRFKGSEEQRLTLLRQAIVDGFDFVDLEIETIEHIRRFGRVKRIVSFHDFESIPDDLEGLYKRMCEVDADIVKIAVTPQCIGDNLKAFEIMRSAKKPTIVLCMGDLGLCTRVLSAKYGAPFSYAAFNPERSIAPGMIPYRPMKSIYRYESIRPDTAVFGVIGDPVGHSLSPVIHNGAFKYLGINAVYVPFRVPRGQLQSFVKEYQSIPVRGFSVTIPHKEQAAKIGGWQHADVAKTGSANTLVMTEEGWKAYNTDTQAAIESLRNAIANLNDPEQAPLENRTVLMVGAGGVARAIAFGLVAEGCQLVITNRTPERAHILANAVGCRMVEWEARHSVLCDTLVNCTSVGMFPEVDQSPIHNSFLKPGILVFDTIYNPSTTMLMREAKERGCHVLGGVDMFVRQAGLQFKLFTGQDPPLEVMMRLIRQALSPVKVAQDEAEPESRGET